MGCVAALIVASVPLTGGSLRQLLRLPLVAPWLLPLTLALQVLVINVVPDAPEPLPVLVHLLTYLLAAGFLWANRHITGMPLLALGGAMNGIAIAANAGTLPASASALRRAGWDTSGTEFANSAVLDHPRLAWLGDNFAIPAPIPFANVFSLGDVVIILGAAIIIHSGSRPPSTREAPAHPDPRRPRRLGLIGLATSAGYLWGLTSGRSRRRLVRVATRPRS